MYSVYQLNKQGDNIQPWRTPFPIWNQSVVPCPILTVASCTAYIFLRRQVRQSCIPISQNFPVYCDLESEALAEPIKQIKPCKQEESGVKWNVREESPAWNSVHCKTSLQRWGRNEGLLKQTDIQGICWKTFAKNVEKKLSSEREVNIVQKLRNK